MTNLFGPDPSLMPVAIRDERGRYLRGMPGRSRPAARIGQGLREDFVADMHGAWLEHRQDVIDRLIAERPEIFPMAMRKITQVHRVELG